MSQELACLKLSGLQSGYPVNFGEALRKNSITRVMNSLEE